MDHPAVGPALTSRFVVPRLAALVTITGALLLALVGPAQAKTTIACYPKVKAAPRSCVVFAAPGSVTRESRVSLRSLRWKNWGSSRATGTGRLSRGSHRVRVRVIADQRLDGSGSGSFYSRLTLIDQAGHRQSLGLDATTETS